MEEKSCVCEDHENISVVKLPVLSTFFISFDAFFLCLSPVYIDCVILLLIKCEHVLMLSVIS